MPTKRSQTLKFIKKETLAQVFSCEFCEIFKKPFLQNTPGRLLLLVNIKEWFTANKLSLNVEKTKYSFFHKLSKKDDIPIRLPKLIIITEIQREESIKFLEVLLNQRLT